ncbi:hypothetical protein DDB_G0281869 [Dictyostelium discoideum AX4]|uniref:Putative uncharacterized protein DDB_G0281869 n=1 Tax=Dictyostelium discoideum TaxID=44689 RepID=Y4259_DICDI|nr:hypothetical protein DDB_G0281869 [Dictyostelium discoideum AX4]Q54TB9.1 RecName: Full=Putative uncharacterized protein DDB_G0281869 [Dictyostelium discoideum]EAL66494.1 hypothetical protein DDB_G0281869 [Dictyostelium discoideum AX4]|eukprot:XP_640470.1 hypothetical protein DDB_G0281869 [Dictyostelium discoideum AX4]
MSQKLSFFQQNTRNGSGASRTLVIKPPTIQPKPENSISKTFSK